MTIGEEPISAGAGIDSGVLRWVRRWLWAATAACLIAPLLLPHLGEGWMRPIAMLPMANCLVVWIVLLFALRRPLGELSVAKYLHASRSLDDSTASHARETSASLRPSYALFLWPFLLIPLSWIVLVAAKP